MNLKIKLLLLLTFINIDAKSLDKKSFKALIASEDKFISSGSYKNQNSVNLKDSNIFTRYYFLKNQNINPFISGGFGLSKISCNNIEFNSKYIKAGFGARYKFNPNMTLLLGYNNSYLINSNRYMHSLYSSFEYEKRFKQIKPFVKTTIKYDKINKSNLKGVNLNLDIGFFTSKITTIYSNPVYQKLYLGYSLFDKDLAKSLDTNNIYTIGSSFYWQIGKKMDYKLLKDLSIVINMQKSVGSNSFEGSKVGVSISFKKF